MDLEQALQELRLPKTATSDAVRSAFEARQIELAGELTTAKGDAERQRLLDALVRLGEALKVVMESDEPLGTPSREEPPVPMPAGADANEAPPVLQPLAEPLEAESNAPREEPLEVLGGRFDLIERVARRPEGDVFRARDRETAEEVAVTRVHASITRDRSLRDLLRAGVRRAGRIRAPGVLRTRDMVLLDGELLILSDAPAGRSLRAARESRRRGLSPTAVRALMRDAAVILRDANAVHGSLTPDSIWLRPGGGVQLSDFAWGQMAPETERHRNQEVSSWLPFAAPERRRAKATDQAVPATADVFALGMAAYYALGGEPTGGQVAPARSLRDDVPRALARTIDASLASIATDRPDSSDAVAAELGAAAPASAGRSAGRRVRVWTFAALLLVACCALAAWQGLLPLPIAQDVDHVASMETVKQELAAARALAAAAGVEFTGLAEELVLVDEQQRPLPDAERIQRLQAFAEEVAMLARAQVHEARAAIEARRAALDGRLQELAGNEQFGWQLLRDTPGDGIPDAQRQVAGIVRLRQDATDLLGAWDERVFATYEWARVVEDIDDVDLELQDDRHAAAAIQYGDLAAELHRHAATLDMLAENVEATRPESGSTDAAEAGSYKLPPEEVAVLLQQAAETLGDQAAAAGQGSGSVTVAPDGTIAIEIVGPEGTVQLGGYWQPVEGTKDQAPDALESTTQVRKPSGPPDAEPAPPPEPGRTPDDTPFTTGIHVVLVVAGKEELPVPARVTLDLGSGVVRGLTGLTATPRPVLQSVLEGLGSDSGRGGNVESHEINVGGRPVAVTLARPTPGKVVRGPRIAVEGSVGGADARGSVELNSRLSPVSGGRFQDHVQSRGEGRTWVEAAHVSRRFHGSARIRRVIVDSTPPRIELRTPAADARLEPGDSVVVSGTVFDLHFDRILINDETVRHRIDGPIAAFEHRVQMPAAQTTKIVVEAFDKAGNRSVVVRHHDRAERSVPDVVILEPADGEILASRKVRVSGLVPESFEDSRLAVNGKTVVVRGGMFETTVTAQRDGHLPIRAAYTGRWIVDTHTVVTVEVDATRPILAVSEPQHEERVPHDYVVVRGTVRDANPARVLVNDRPYRVSRSGTFRARVPLLSPQAWTTISVAAEDEAGHVSDTITRRVFSDYTVGVPTPRIIEPRGGSVHPPGAILVRGRVPSMTEHSVVTVNGQRVSAASGSFQTEIQASEDGLLVIEVVHGGQGIREARDSVEVLVDASAPTLQIYYPTRNTYKVRQSRITVEGRVSDPSLQSLVVMANGRSRRVTRGRGGRFEASVNLMPYTDTHIVIQATDAGGLVTTEERRVYYDKPHIDPPPPIGDEQEPGLPETSEPERPKRQPPDDVTNGFEKSSKPAPRTYKLQVGQPRYEIRSIGGPNDPIQRWDQFRRWTGGSPPQYSYEVRITVHGTYSPRARDVRVRLRGGSGLRVSGSSFTWQTTYRYIYGEPGLQRRGLKKQPDYNLSFELLAAGKVVKRQRRVFNKRP